MVLERIPVRIRLSLGYALLMGIVFTLIGISIYRVVADSLLQSVDTTIVTTARAMRDNRASHKSWIKELFPSPEFDPFIEMFLDDDNGSIRTYSQLVDTSGKIQLSHKNSQTKLPVTPIAVMRASKGLETFETMELGRGLPLIRQITVPVIRKGRFTGELVQVGAPLDTMFSVLKNVRRLLWVSLSIGLGTTIFFGYLLVRRSFRPVTQISLAASRTRAEDLGFRLKLPQANDELRNLARTFNEMLDRLEDAFGRLRRFSGDVSHELRTPIAVLKGEVELALRRERTPEEYRKALQTVLKEASSMTLIIDDLLLLARVQGNAIALNREEVQIERLFMDVETSVKTVLNERQITLQRYIFGLSPIAISPRFMSLVIRNLILNAIKHSDPGSSIELRFESFPDRDEIIVKDFGEGIAEESLPYIFDPFYRADTARNRARGGAGIGLSLAQALVKLHGGTLQVTSQLGQGSVFTIRLPKSPSSLSTGTEKAGKASKAALVASPAR